MDPFKDQYKQAKSPSERQHIAMNIIFKQLFLYWTQNDGPINADDAKIRGENLVYWLRNNWRGPRQRGTSTAPLVVKKSNVVYKLKRQAVWDEIAVILGVEHADTTTKDWFPTRPIAICNVMERMTPAEHREMDEAVAKIEREGYSLDEKQINATKHCTHRFQDTAKRQWLEMGALSVSIVSYRNRSNQLVVEIHENSCNVTGVKMKEEFQDRHREKLRELQRLWLDYVRELLDKQEGKHPQAHAQTVGVGFNTQTIPVPAKSDETSLTLGYSDDGFPRLPAGLNLDKLNKKDGCALLRTYLAQNYHLGTHRQSDQVPYRSMMESASAQAQYIDPKFLPPNFRLADLQNMKLSLIRNFFRHVKAREDTQTSSQVFRFRRANSTRRKGEMMDTLYPDEIDPQNPPIVKKRASKPRKKAVTKNEDSTDAAQQTVQNLSLVDETAAMTAPTGPTTWQPAHTGDLEANSTRRKGEMMDTSNPDGIDPQNPPIVKKRASKPKKKAAKKKGKSTDAGQHAVQNLSLVDTTAAMTAPTGSKTSQPAHTGDLEFLKYDPNGQDFRDAGQNLPIAPFTLTPPAPADMLWSETGQGNGMVDTLRWPSDQQPEFPGIDTAATLYYDTMHNAALEHMYNFDAGLLTNSHDGDFLENYSPNLNVGIPEHVVQRQFNPFLTPPPDPVYRPRVSNMQLFANPDPVYHSNNPGLADPAPNHWWNYDFSTDKALPHNPQINFGPTWNDTHHQAGQPDQRATSSHITESGIQPNPEEASNLTEKPRHDSRGRPLPVLKVKNKAQAPGQNPGASAVLTVVTQRPTIGATSGSALTTQNLGTPLVGAVSSMDPPTDVRPANEPATTATNLADVETRPRLTADALALAEAGTLANSGKRKRVPKRRE